MNIGERIKMRRKELELSVDDVAEKLGKNRATVYRYESNDIENLPITILEPLAKILETTPAYLMGWTNNSSIYQTINEERNLYGVPDKSQKENKIKTIAAHAIEDLTEEEQTKVLEYVKFLKSQREK